jgi:hypothetical protein
MRPHCAITTRPCIFRLGGFISRATSRTRRLTSIDNDVDGVDRIAG